MKNNNPIKNIKLAMIAMLCIAYTINALMVLFVKNFNNFEVMFNNFDFVALFQLGFIVGLWSVYGYISSNRPLYKQIFTVAYMLPITGMSIFTMVIMHFLNRADSSNWLPWGLAAVAMSTLISSFLVCFRAAELTLADTYLSVKN